MNDLVIGSEVAGVAISPVMHADIFPENLVLIASAALLATLLSGGLMLEQLGLDEGAAALQRAVRAALDEGVTTPDLGGSAKTAEVGRWIAGAIA